MKGNPFTGIRYFQRGLKSLTNPGLKRFIVLPLLLNIVLMGSVSWWGISEISGLVETVIEWLPSWLSWLSWILLPVAVVTLLVVVIYFFSAILNLIASPFNGLLSEALETQMTGQPLPEESLAATIARTLARELRKLAYFIPRYLLLLVISFIPVINVASPVLWFLFGAWVLTLQYLDYAMDNNGHSFAELHQALRKQPLTTLGFGFVVAIGFMIPIVNMLVMPAAVSGATLYWVEQLKQEFPKNISSAA
jgi:CysZ protein